MHGIMSRERIRQKECNYRKGLERDRQTQVEKLKKTNREAKERYDRQRARKKFKSLYKNIRMFVCVYQRISLTAEPIWYPLQCSFLQILRRFTNILREVTNTFQDKSLLDFIFETEIEKGGLLVGPASSQSQVPLQTTKYFK